MSRRLGFSIGGRNVSIFVARAVFIFFLSLGHVGFLMKKAFLSCSWLVLRQSRLHLPASAEGFVKGDEILRDGLLALDELVLGQIERALGVEDVEEVRKAFGIEFIGQFHRPLIGLRSLLQ